MENKKGKTAEAASDSNDRLGGMSPKDRRAFVLHLRVKGKTLREVGEIIGVTTERVRQLEGKALADIGLEPWSNIRAQELAKARELDA